MLKDHLMLALVWLLWCGIHSFLITPEVNSLAQRILGEKHRYYRLGYSLFSLISLLPVLVYEHRLDTPLITAWSGWPGIIRWPLVVLGTIIALYGLLSYDLSRLFGLSALFEKEAEPRDELITSGALAIVRHPLYLSGILLVWTLRPLTGATLITALVLTFYFIGGSLLEEVKLYRNFGGEYALYAAKVPRFNPFPRLRGKLRLP